MATILLVDDDALLRDTVHQLLELDGHRVIDMVHGQAGLQYLHGHAKSVDLVITDMLMPVMDGAEFIVELKKHHPRMPVIAVSGGRRSLSPQFNLDTANMLGVAKSLPKPFGRDALQAAIRSVLSP